MSNFVEFPAIDPGHARYSYHKRPMSALSSNVSFELYGLKYVKPLKKIKTGVVHVWCMQDGVYRY